MDQNEAQSGSNTAAQDKKEAETEELSMESLLAQGDFSLDLPKQGEIRKGVIASVTDDEVLVSIGAKSEGIIPGRELTQLPPEERDKLAIGEEIQVFVISPFSRQGTMILSIQRALEEEDWVHAEELMKNNEAFQGEVSGYNKGGLIVNMGHLRGFVPASQVSISRRMTYSGDTPDDRWGNMVGEPIAVRVIEVDRQRRRLIFSEKAASQESRDSLKDRLLQELEEDTVRKGRVTSLADFGAFVNINGADGLVHLSEISWERIDHPKEVLEVGQEVEVKIISIDLERRRIGLSIRQLQKDPWEDYVIGYKVGQLIEGTITRLTKFGAFARIDENLEGLIHVSELSEKRIEHPKEVLSESDKVTLRIIKIDKERRRIGLSLRKVESLQYSELDWEMALADIEGMEEFAAKAPQAEEEIPSDEAEAPVEETPPTEDAEAPVEEVEETPPAEDVEAPVDEAEEAPPAKDAKASVDEAEEAPPAKDAEAPADETVEEAPPAEDVEAPVDEAEEAPPAKDAEASVDEAEEALPAKDAEAPVEEVEETPPAEDVEAPVEEAEEAPPTEDVEAPVEEVEETPPAEDVEAPVEEVEETPPAEDVEAPVDEAEEALPAKDAKAPADETVEETPPTEDAEAPADETVEEAEEAPPTEDAEAPVDEAEETPPAEDVEAPVEEAEEAPPVEEPEGERDAPDPPPEEADEAPSEEKADE